MEDTKLKLVFRHKRHCSMLGHLLHATAGTDGADRTLTFGLMGGKEFITHSLYC